MGFILRLNGMKGYQAMRGRRDQFRVINQMATGTMGT